MELAKIKLSLEIESGKRAEAISTIKERAFFKGIELNIEEERGVLDSNYRITVIGQTEEVDDFKQYVNAYINEINNN